MDPIVTILIFVAVIGIAAVLFTGWVFVAVIKLIMRAIPRRIHSPTLPARPTPAAGDIRCPRDNCRNYNPSPAKFCRRCGINLVAEQIKTPSRSRRRIALQA